MLSARRFGMVAVLAVFLAFVALASLRRLPRFLATPTSFRLTLVPTV